MKLKFNYLKLHHFLSFGDAEINLEGRGYTLISGRNHNPKDNALSNGSGKSSLWSAICWAITGETIQGISKNIPNNYYEDGCWVELDFEADADKYKIIRYRECKVEGTDLKIFINGENKSGKGIKESQALLDQYLPDLTSKLIGSIIILGQGLPHKFSDNTPAGRKEVLEQLSKSDFMIEDIKERIAHRQIELNDIQRKNEDIILENSTKVNLYQTELNKQKLELENHLKIDKNVYETQIILFRELISTNEENQKELEKELREVSELNETYNKKLIPLTEDFNNNKEEKFKTYTSKLDAFKNKKNQVQLDYNSVSNEITKIKNIKDVCPTCHRPFEGVSKPDLQPYYDKLNEYTSELNELNNQINELENDYNKEIFALKEAYNKLTAQTSLNIQNSRLEINKLTQEINSKKTELSKYYIDLKKVELELSNYNSKTEQLDEKIIATSKLLSEAQVCVEETSKSKENIASHLSVINQFNTLVKRDFRGILLASVVAFINQKGKEYAQDIFNCDEFELTQDGNNLNISYCGKLYESLSGGEKQKIDLITQFALRDMLCNYMDFRSNILVLDEIFDNLDALGVDKVINLISTKFTDIDSIFIVSHHSDELDLSYDDEIVIEKNNFGISSIL